MNSESRGGRRFFASRARLSSRHICIPRRIYFLQSAVGRLSLPVVRPTLPSACSPLAFPRTASIITSINCIQYTSSVFLVWWTTTVCLFFLVLRPLDRGWFNSHRFAADAQDVLVDLSEFLISVVVHTDGSRCPPSFFIYAS